ncbi:protein Dr1-like [Planococcus citri]|uniref:protein Dr1-like n=1 Tax=Planococcus citri TaxID=170843 RepID=UPI0031F9D661
MAGMSSLSNNGLAAEALLFGGSEKGEDEDLALPRASLNKLIKEVLPDLRVANEVRDLLLQCCSEFIHLISSEANEICKSQQKKTMSTEHVLLALEKMGFGEFKEDVEEIAKTCKEKRRRQSTRLENLGIPEEELYRQQQELFAKAREEQTVHNYEQWHEIQMATMRTIDENSNDDEENYDEISE